MNWKEFVEYNIKHNLPVASTFILFMICYLVIGILSSIKGDLMVSIFALVVLVIHIEIIFSFKDKLEKKLK